MGVRSEVLISVPEAMLPSFCRKAFSVLSPFICAIVLVIGSAHSGAGLFCPSVAFAQNSLPTSAPAAIPTGATPYEFIFGTVQFFLLSFFVYYMLVLRPQQLREEEQGRFLKTLKKDDDVLTSGGIFGKVVSVGDGFVSVEIASGTKIKIQPQHLFSASSNSASKADSKGSESKSSESKSGDTKGSGSSPGSSSASQRR